MRVNERPAWMDMISSNELRAMAAQLHQFASIRLLAGEEYSLGELIKAAEAREAERQFYAARFRTYLPPTEMI